MGNLVLSAFHGEGLAGLELLVLWSPHVSSTVAETFHVTEPNWGHHGLEDHEETQVKEL